MINGQVAVSVTGCNILGLFNFVVPGSTPKTVYILPFN